jgi:alkylation response protein AidB-like acyl-CoA dehydrogenase
MAAPAAALLTKRSSTANLRSPDSITFGAPLHSGIVAPYILHYGTEDQKKRLLPKLATGEMVGAIAMTEPGTGSDLQGVRANAKKSGNGYVSTGRRRSSQMDSTPI